MTKNDTNPSDWKKQKRGWPYKGDALEDPQYMKDRNNLFYVSEDKVAPYNGWWWYQGSKIWKQSYNRRRNKRR